MSTISAQSSAIDGPSEPGAPPERPEPAKLLPEPWQSRMMRRAQQASMVGVLVSLVVHLMFLSVAGVWRLGVAGGGDGAVGVGGPIEVSTIDETELGSLQDSELALTSAGIEETKTESTTPGVDLMAVPGGSGLADNGELGSVGAGLGGAGTGQGIGVGGGEGGSGGGGAKFFGVEARGNRFTFIVDISGSMEGPKLALLKRELVSAIDGLAENAQFLVFFFSSETVSLSTRDKWIDATAGEKKQALRKIMDVAAFGGTEPGPAFRRAFDMRPKTDAIYFMTDGIFDPRVAELIAADMKKTGKVPVNCIAIGERGSEATMKKIAENSGGTYRFVEEPRR